MAMPQATVPVDGTCQLDQDAIMLQLRQANSEVLAELKKANEELKKANKKDPKPVPTGIKPRGLLIVALIGVMIVPILISIVLPVFYSAKTARARETSAEVYLCSLYADDRQADVLAKYNAFARLDDAIYNQSALPASSPPPNARPPPSANRPPSPPSPAPFAAQYLAAYKALVAAEASFFADLQASCSIIGQSLWGTLDDDRFSSTRAGNTWLQAVVNIQPQFSTSRPLPPPPPPASSKDDGSSGSSGSFEAPPDYDGGSDGDYDYLPPIPPSVPLVLPSPPPPKPTGGNSATSAAAANITQFQKRVPQVSQAVAAWSTINATVTSVDVAVNTITVNFEMRLDSLVLQTAKNTRVAKRSAKSIAAVKYPALLDRTGRIKGKDTLTKTDVVSAAGSDGTLSLKTGDRVTSKKMELSLVPTTSLYMYPFDQYTATVTLVSSMTVADINCPTALFVKQKNAVVGWTFNAKLVPRITENRNVFNFQNPKDADSAITLTYEIHLKRTTFVQFFAVFVVIGLWIVSACSFCYAMDLLYIRPRNVTNGDATLFTAQLFSVVGTRNIMPGVPAVGVGVDFFGIIWIMIICLLTGGQVYARIVAQYVHKEPTIYDRLVRNEVWVDGWLKEQEDAEKMAKEKKEKEEERKKKIEKYGVPGGKKVVKYGEPGEKKVVKYGEPGEKKKEENKSTGVSNDDRSKWVAALQGLHNNAGSSRV
ncbi:hypothetical protein HYH02_006669 [Chlamydomonas schloesseri]|uniref:Uncharacterized protein n=1 Tax=Chlamydomonas schloesseri TaxID=2026947 RepID=A0A835ST13_9CHLO|nr:hypothetical protein HYH02_006669 [Chlamydomonas schloesseri]|eukprot:KAG2432684.1 hypothetical protein HYH02_006669 [Chlamydomonas schloesseri]